MKPLDAVRTDKGRFSVREFEAPLWLVSGATTVRSPRPPARRPALQAQGPSNHHRSKPEFALCIRKKIKRAWTCRIVPSAAAPCSDCACRQAGADATLDNPYPGPSPGAVESAPLRQQRTPFPWRLPNHSLAFTAALILLAYLIGSVPFAVVVSKLMGLQDLRSYGSKNPGATNVLRTGNKTGRRADLAGRRRQGMVRDLAGRAAGPRHRPRWPALVALAAFVGHLYPVFLGFKGGKGVATALGVLVAIQPWLAVATAATWLIIAIFFRYSSLASLVAAFVCARCITCSARAWPGMPKTAGHRRWPCIGVLLFYRHRANITRLVRHRKQDRRRQEKISGLPDALDENGGPAAFFARLRLPTASPSFCLPPLPTASYRAEVPASAA